MGSAFVLSFYSNTSINKLYSKKNVHQKQQSLEVHLVLQTLNGVFVHPKTIFCVNWTPIVNRKYRERELLHAMRIDAV